MKRLYGSEGVLILMKIAFVSSFFGTTIGGAEISMELLAESLRDKGHEIYILTTRKIQGANNHTASLPYVNWIPKKLLRLGNPFIDRVLALQLFRKIKKVSPNIVHAQDVCILPALVSVSKKAKIPVVVTVRDNLLDSLTDLRWPFPISTFLKKRNKVIIENLKEAHAIISVSNFIKKELVKIGINHKKVYPIYNLPPNWDVQKKEDSFGQNPKIALLASGRLAKEKGFSVLIKAMKSVAEKEDNIKLTIVGDGPQRKNLLELTKNLGISRFITFVGRVPYKKMKKYYFDSDIVIFPSIDPEPFGRVAIEAMVAGKPVIASDTGAIPEIVRNGENGLLVPPNSHEKLAAAIIKLVKNKNLRDVMGRKGSIILRKEFNSDKITEQCLSLYNKIVRAQSKHALQITHKEMEKTQIKKSFLGSRYSKSWILWLKQNAIYEKEITITARLAGDVKGKSVLDIGTGTGRFALLFSRLGAYVTAVDISRSMIEIAKKTNVTEKNVQFIVADVEHPPFIDYSFDVVNCQEVLVHLPDPRVAVKEMMRIARDNIIVSASTLPCKAFLKFWKKIRLAKGATRLREGILAKESGSPIYVRYFTPSELKVLFLNEGAKVDKMIAIGILFETNEFMKKISEAFPKSIMPFNLIGYLTMIRAKP